MSKKLLMNNYSENGLTPIMKGLICWLDGRDGKNGDTVWLDRTGNCNNGILYNFGSQSFNNGYLISNNSVNYIKLFENIEIKNKTFIINIELDSSNRDTFLMGYWGWHIGADSFGIINRYPSNIYSSVLWSKNKSEALKGVLSNFPVPTVYTNIAITITNNEVKTFINSKLIKTSIIEKELLINSFYLLRKDDALNNCCKAKIGSFMTYNRALTEEEVKKNYEYELFIERG